MKNFFFLLLIVCSIQSFAREKLVLQVKDIAKQPKENRLNYFFALEYSWQKETWRYKSIDSLKQIAKDLGDDELYQYADLLKYEYDIYFAKNPKQKETLFKKAEQFTEKSDIPELKAHLYYAIGIYAFYMKEIRYGLPLVYEGKKYLEQLNYQSFRHRAYYYKGFFDVYYDFEDFNKAIEIANLALKNPHDLLYYPEDYYNNIALCYRRMKDYDKAMQYFKFAIQDAKKRNDKSFEALVEGNIAYIYYLKEDYQGALPFLYRNYAINKDKLPEESNLIRYMLARCLLKLDSLNKAETYLRYPDSKIPIWSHPAYKLDKYRAMTLYFEKKGDLQRAIKYRDSITVLTNRIRQDYDLAKLNKFELQVEAEHAMNDKLNLQNEVERQKLLRNSIIAFLTLLFVSVAAFFYLRYKKEKQLQWEKQKRAEQQVVDAQIQLDLFINNIKEKNAIIEKFSTEANQNTEPTTKINQADYHILGQLQKSVILTEDSWKDFKEIFEKIYPSFFTKLSFDYPDMSPAETRIVALQKLNLSTKDMANMLGISVDSIKKARYRLRKKYPDLLAVDKNQEDISEEEST